MEKEEFKVKLKLINLSINALKMKLIMERKSLALSHLSVSGESLTRCLEEAYTASKECRDMTEEDIKEFNEESLTDLLEGFKELNQELFPENLDIGSAQELHR